MNNKEHITMEGLHKILCLLASMNLGLSKQLQTVFTEIIPIPRPLI